MPPTKKIKLIKNYGYAITEAYVNKL